MDWDEFFVVDHKDSRLEIFMFGSWLWLACDAVKLILKVGFICFLMVINPTFLACRSILGATIVVAQPLCLAIFNLSPTAGRRRIPAFLSMVIKLLVVCVCACARARARVHQDVTTTGFDDDLASTNHCAA